MKKDVARLPPRQKITAWSFSRWDAHSGENGCPYKAYLKFVEKRPEPSGEAMSRGAKIHDLARIAIEAPRIRVAPELKQVSADIRRLRGLDAQAELELSLTKDWVKTGWFDATAWCRIKIDVIAAAGKDRSSVEVVDWKTGKYRTGDEAKAYGLQLELYGAGILSAYEDVERVTGRLVFTDHDQKAAPPVEATYARKDLPRLVATWEKRVKPMLADTRYAPRPGFYCRYCHFRKANNGPCQY